MNFTNFHPNEWVDLTKEADLSVRIPVLLSKKLKISLIDWTSGHASSNSKNTMLERFSSNPSLAQKQRAYKLGQAVKNQFETAKAQNTNEQIIFNYLSETENGKKETHINIAYCSITLHSNKETVDGIFVF